MAAAAGSAKAGGYALIGQSAASAGVAYAGVSALENQAETAWYNPAGLAFFEGRSLSWSADLLLPESDFSDEGSVDALGAPRLGSATGGGAAGVVPSAYAIAPIGDRLVAGLAVNAPYGQKTDYDDAFVGRYEALLSELLAINVSLNAGFRVNDWLAVGGGVDVLYADTTLTNAVDFGAVCLGAGVPPAACAGAGLSPQAADGVARIEGDGVAVGFNLGVMARFERTRVGLHFRSPVEIDIDGDARFSLPAAAAALPLGGAFAPTAASTTLRFPATVGLGVAYDATDRLTLMAQAIWTDWSRIDTIAVDFDNPAQPDAALRSDWRDSVYFGVGATWRWDDDIVLRAGLGFDQTPVTDRFRTPRLTGADAYSVAVGVGWRVSETWRLDVAYQRFFYDEAPVDLSAPESGRLVGAFSNSADVVSLQASYRF